ncbi:NUDIX hydrolase [Candidatus Saccharibacteria bacterium]|nr:NUDIX hydrolase [Candidatus Saccharibacteria bacterium]
MANVKAMRYNTGMRTILPKDAKLVPSGAERVFRGKIFEVYQWQQEMFDGSYETFEALKRSDTVNIFAVKDGKLVILKQQQPGSPVFYGVPGGRHDDPGETELEAAKREMLEETGMTFRNWKLIWVTQPASKMEWFVYSFLATDFETQVPQKLDAGEKISVQLMTIDEARDIIRGLAPNSRADFPREIFDNINTIEELENWPEYQGRAV